MKTFVNSPLEADLSRADVDVLIELCTDKRVVEFGAGGSTPLLAQFCQELISYEPDERWLKRIRAAINLRRKRGTDYCPVRYRHVPRGAVPRQLPKADVYFIDAKLVFRPAWLRAVIQRKLAPQIIMHDSRRTYPLLSCRVLLQWPWTAWIKSIEYHYRDSNHFVINLRAEPVEYENWNQTEPENRLPHLSGERLRAERNQG